ncbi:nucleoside-diphosphate sugar epimerase/dehydratase [Helcococcus ovis]|uniref:polysaccharide biosynthesis protein n=1 Tax=Helcococcus ovis TaxID=72026 RepID=UPI0039170D70
MNDLKKKIQHWQFINFGLLLFDIAAIQFGFLFALMLRFDFSYTTIPSIYIKNYMEMTPYYTVITLIVFYILKMYKSLWRFASVPELFKGIYSFFITTAIHYVIALIFKFRMPASYFIVGGLVQFLMVTGVRFAYKIYLILITNRIDSVSEKLINNVLIVGAGEAGRMIAHDIRNYEKEKYIVKGFIDDNPNKWGRYILSIPILGNRDTILSNSVKYKIDTIIIAIPSASIEMRQDIINIAKETGAKLKIIPSIPDLLDSNNVTMKQLKDVQIEDLLERDSIKINTAATMRNISGKVVLVTGGGGTIGSELSRQIAQNNPKQLILFDIYENNTYEIEQELRRKYKDLNLVAVIGSVREQKRLDDVFNQYRPNIVYHAAAHKHVPLMEVSPNEAIKNNIYGTFNTAYAALRYNVEKFILISTDKAVNPTSVMGTTKRVCEMIIQSMDYVIRNKDLSKLPKLDIINQGKLRDFDCKFVTNFVAVRFGNVLGSNGSVIPLFKKQIAEGGPVTVTHKDIIRYFMTISEAVGLVIEAGFYAKGGEIFVLDMGEPVKIDTLARNLIKLSGYVPDQDIRIEYTGLRPGEKLYEEKLMSEEGLRKTENQLIHIAQPIDFDNEIFFDNLISMQNPASKNDVTNVLKYLSTIVPTYHSSESDLLNNKEKFEQLYKTSK